MRNSKNANGKSKRSSGSAKKSKTTKRSSGHSRRPSEIQAGRGAGNSRLENA
jgi:hypothetical protein